MMTDSSIYLPFSPACERNQNSILDTISPYLEQVKTVLEIGTGTAQHIIYFAKAFPSIVWQPSDQEQYLEGVKAQLAYARLRNVKSPLLLDVNQTTWIPDRQRYGLIYTANTFHIMTQSDVESFFSGLALVTEANAFLVVYGPFRYAGKFTSQSNHDFDQTLRSRGVGSAIRDFEFVDELAQSQGFYLLEDFDMPANNQCLVWRKLANESAE